MKHPIIWPEAMHIITIHDDTICEENMSFHFNVVILLLLYKTKQILYCYVT